MKLFPSAIVVPTRHESGNVLQLHRELDAALGDRKWRLLFVDDSDDRTIDLLRELEAKDQRVSVIHRPIGQRQGGLGGAVCEGFEFLLSGIDVDALVVMDADLQHPPSVVPRLLDALTESDADLVVASRYAAHGSAAGLEGTWRKLVSQMSRVATHRAIKRSRFVTDPLSGCFAFRADVVRDVTLRPDGYKVLLEILVPRAVVSGR